jgi:hypothetical protein
MRLTELALLFLAAANAHDIAEAVSADVVLAPAMAPNPKARP